MKNMILLFVTISFTAMSCEENENEQETSIYGTWKLVGRFDGGSLEPNQSVENGYTLTLTLSGQAITTNETIGCTDSYEELFGSFSMDKDQNADILSLSFECSDQTVLANYYFGFDKESLLLTEQENTCDEGCYFRFKKIAEPPIEE